MVKMKGFPYGAAAATGMGQDKDSALADFLYGEESLPGEPPSLDELAPEAVFMSEAAPQTPVADINDESDVSTINLQNFLYGPEGGAGIISTDPFAPNPAAPPIRRTADGTPLHLVGDMTKENVDKWTDISLHGSINDKMDALKNSEEFGAPPALEYAMSEALARDFIKKHGIDRPLSAYAGFADTEGELRAWSGGTDVMEKGTTKTPPLAAFSELEPISTSLQKKEAVPETHPPLRWFFWPNTALALGSWRVRRVTLGMQFKGFRLPLSGSHRTSHTGSTRAPMWTSPLPRRCSTTLRKAPRRSQRRLAGLR